MTGRAAIGAVLLLAALLPASGAGAAAGEAFHLDTRDGLSLVLGESGAVQAVRVRGRRLVPTGAPGGFAIRMAGRGPNLLANAGFEQDGDGNGVPDGWTLSPAASGVAVDRAVAHGGGVSVRLSRASTAITGRFQRDVAVLPGTSYFLRAWLRSEGIQPTSTTADTPSRRSPLRIEVRQLLGSRALRTHYAYGYTDTAGWHLACAGITTLRGVRRVRIVGHLVQGSGTAWVDDLHLARLLPETAVPVGGRVAPAGAGLLRQSATLRREGLRLQATFRAGTDHLRVDGALTGLDGREKAVQVEYVLPFDVTGWTWSDHARSARPILPGRSYSYETRWNDQPMSRYPFSEVHDGQSALALAIPLDVPRVFRIRAGPEGLRISFDLGISPATTRLGPRATFSFVVYTHDPAWAHRAATRKYYDIFPSFFVRRTEPAREGIWYSMPPLPPLEPVWQDFGLGLNMVALGTYQDGYLGVDPGFSRTYLAFDNSRGIYASSYNHHWVIRQRIPPGTVPPYEEALRRLREDATAAPTDYEQTVLRDLARAALVSTARDVNGRLLYERYLADRLQFYQVLDPQPARGADAVRLAMTHQVERDLELAQGLRLDGIHMDSTAGMRRWGDAENYSRALWAQTGLPLTFSYRTGRVAQKLVFPIYEHLARVSDFAHARGMILSANFNGSEARSGSFFGADRIDYFGLERGLPEKTGEQDPYVSMDSLAMQKRTLAFQRPLSTLDQREGAGILTAAEGERRLQRNLFYGIFPGIGLQHVWTEEQRARYARYTPLFRALSAAGWEPVTNARSSEPQVWVERFGSLASGTLHLSVRNETGAPRAFTLAVDLDRDGLARVDGLEVRELLADALAPVTLEGGGTRAVLQGTAGPGQTLLYRLTTAP